MMHVQFYLPFIFYLLGTLGISLYATRKKYEQETLTQYFLGNKKINSFMLAMTFVATYMSASTFIGGPGAAYRFGLGWVLLAFIQLPTLWLTLAVVGKKVAVLGQKLAAVTLNDLIWARYQSKCLLLICVLTVLFSFFAIIVAQLVGGARLLETVADIPYRQGLFLFAGFTLTYTAFGGFRAVVWTDALQGIIMLIGTLVLLAWVIDFGGGLTPMLERLHDIDPSLLAPSGAENFLTFSFMFSFWVLICFGAICLPQNVTRCLSIHPQQSMKKTIVIGTAISALMLVALNFTGVLGRVLLPELDVSDKVIPQLIIYTLPTPLASLMLAVPMAAIMSTVDSLLLQTSATLIKDLILRFMPIQIGHRLIQKKGCVRGVTFALGLMAVISAMTPPDMLLWLNLIAFGALEVAFLWPLLCGLYWRGANATGAIISVVIGISSYTTLMTLGIKIAGLHAIVPALLLAGLGMLFGSIYGKRSTHFVDHLFFSDEQTAAIDGELINALDPNSYCMPCRKSQSI